MQESWSFKFPKTTDNPEQLIQTLEVQHKELGIFLSYYYKKEGAVAEKVELKGRPEFLDKLSGKLTLVFDLVYFNACLAIHEQAKEKMEITFEIDPEKEQLKLIGAYWPSREMDEI